MHQFDTKILVLLADNGYELSTVEVMDKLTTKPNALFSGPSIGSIHVAGRRLEDGGFIQIVRRPGGAERGFAQRVLFRLTGEGLAEARSAVLEQMP